MGFLKFSCKNSKIIYSSLQCLCALWWWDSQWYLLWSKYSHKKINIHKIIVEIISQNSLVWECSSIWCIVSSQIYKCHKIWKTTGKKVVKNLTL